MKQLTRQEAERLETVQMRRRVDHGAHTSRQDGMCAMELVAYVAGEGHSDQPECVCPVIAGLARYLNDTIGSDYWRAIRILPLLPKMLHTRGSEELEVRRRIRSDAATYDPNFFGVNSDGNIAGLIEELCEMRDPEPEPIAPVPEMGEARAIQDDGAAPAPARKAEAIDG